MKKILLIIAAVFFVHTLPAQTIGLITGRAAMCISDSSTLSDTTLGGRWSSSNITVATIGSSTGIVRGIAAGTANITYTSGALFITKLVTVNPLPLAITGPAYVCTGNTALISDATASGTWSSGSVTVATVGSFSGIVTGVSSGIAVLTYRLATGCFSILNIPVNSTAISGPSTVCRGGASITLTDATAGGAWSSSNPAVATVGASSGVVSGISAGIAVISYNIGSGCSGVTTITVRPLPVISPSPILGCVGSSTFLTGTPFGGSWSSSNPAVAAINFVGNLTAISAGTTTITYTAAGGCATSAVATVNPDPLPITGTNYVYSGFTTPLTDLSGSGVWSSSNPALATIDPTGVVTGVAAGLVVISYTLPVTGCASTYYVQVNPLPATANLQSWYPFCGDTSDQSLQILGGGPHPLLNHIGIPAILDTDRFGNANNAYSFSGGECIMEYSTFIPNSGTPPDFTYSCWIKPTVAQSSIIMYNGDPNMDGFGFIMDNGAGYVGGVAPTGGPGTFVGVLFGGVGLFLPTDLTTIPTSFGTSFGTAWYNLVLVKSGNSYHFYINDDAGSFFIATFNPMSIGSHFALGNNEALFNVPPTASTLGYLGFQGDIDDVALINRQLTAPERLSLYNYNPDAIPFTLGADTTICADFMYLSPKPQTLGGKYTWETYIVPNFDTTNTTDTIITVFPAPGPTGNQYVLHISKPYGCSTADTINVFKTPIPVNLGAALQNFCIGDTVTLTSYFPRSSFLWSTGDTTHSIRVTGTGTYYVTVDSTVYFTSALGTRDSSVCVGRDTVKLHASTIPTITVPANVADCDGRPDTIVTHFDSGYTYLWNTTRTNDTGFILVSGTYWVEVSDSGCVRSDTIRAIIVADTASLTNGDVSICKGDKVTASATLNPIVSYQWTPTAGISSSNLSTTTIIPDTSAEYYLTIRYLGCANKVDSFHIDVQPRPSVYIGGNRDLCEGDTLHITAKVNPAWYQHYLYSWTPGNANLDSTDVSTVVYTAFTRHDSEELVVKVYPPVFLSVPGDSLCYAVDSAAIFVHPRFTDTISAKFAICPGDSVQLKPGLDSLSSSLGVIVSASKWSPGTYLSDSTALYPWVHAITSVNYRVIAFSQYGCADTAFTSVTVYPAAVINVGDSVILAPGQSHQISPETNCTVFSWYPPLGLDQTNVSNPLASPTASTTYYVAATTANDCVVFDSLRIHIDPGTLVAIPNAFTPGAGINKTFSVIPKGAIELNYFRIFDRWGNMVYESSNIEAGWDGNFNGKPQPFGVYVYDLEAVTSIGTVFHRVGNVTLIR